MDRYLWNVSRVAAIQPSSRTIIGGDMNLASCLPNHDQTNAEQALQHTAHCWKWVHFAYKRPDEQTISYHRWHRRPSKNLRRLELAERSTGAAYVVPCHAGNIAVGFPETVI